MTRTVLTFPRNRDPEVCRCGGQLCGGGSQDRGVVLQDVDCRRGARGEVQGKIGERSGCCGGEDCFQELGCQRDGGGAAGVVGSFGEEGAGLGVLDAGERVSVEEVGEDCVGDGVVDLVVDIC